MDTIKRISNKTGNFTMVLNECFQREDLSARAKGLFAYIMTLPSNWIIHRREIYSHFTEGRDALDTAFNELREAGYIKMDEIRDKGKIMGYQYQVFESVIDEPYTEKPLPGKPFPVKPFPENPPLLSTNLTNYESLQNTHTQEASVLESIKYPNGYPRILFDKWQAIPGAIPTRDYFNWLQTDFREISSAICGIDSDIVLKSLDNFKHVRENPKDTWMKANPSMKKFFTGEMFGQCRPEVFGKDGAKDAVLRCKNPKCGWELAHNGEYAGQCINDECDMYHKEQI